MAKEKQKPGPAGEVKPMGMTATIAPEEELDFLKERIRILEAAVNRHYQYHFGRKAI
jgi:hypothetical protein